MSSQGTLENWFDEFTKRHEGLRLKPYKDTLGALTIGWGHNLDAVGISEEAAQQLFEDDRERAFSDATQLSFWKQLPEVWQRVVLAMMFQLGAARFAGFVRLNAALAVGDWDAARSEMLNSRWAQQTPARAKELHDMTMGEVA